MALVLEPEAPAVDETPAPATWPQSVSSGDDEWYTPREVIALVTEVLGAIDVDPASCAFAQQTVQAHTFYTKDDDGLRQPWVGTVFCNPPYKMPDVGLFIDKLCAELGAGHTTEAILLVNNSTETDWFQRAFRRANAVCFPDGKIHFLHPTRDGRAGPCVGQVLLYFGPHADRFCVVFAAFGVSTLVCCADAPDAQLALTPAPLIREADYCVVHLPPSTKGSADVEPCSIQGCPQTAHYRFWTHDPRPTGLVWVHRHRLCPAHMEAWCTAHEIDIGAIPTITVAAWVSAWEAGDYDQIPWFRYGAHAAPAA